MKCPRCEPQEMIKNGKIHNGKQRYKCKSCGRHKEKIHKIAESAKKPKK